MVGQVLWLNVLKFKVYIQKCTLPSCIDTYDTITLEVDEMV